MEKTNTSCTTIGQKRKQTNLKIPRDKHKNIVNYNLWGTAKALQRGNFSIKKLYDKKRRRKIKRENKQTNKNNVAKIIKKIEVQNW